MATTAGVVAVVRAILIILGLLGAGAALQNIQPAASSGDVAWGTIAQEAQREIVVTPALPEYLRTAPLLLAETLPPPPADGTVTDMPELGKVYWGTHASDRHGDEARLARACALQAGVGSYWRCKDGDGHEKVYIITQVLRHEGETLRAYWTFVALLAKGGGEYLELTSFITERQAYIQTVLDRDGCKQIWRWAHP